MELKNIVSLFDGMSCLQIALIEQNISFKQYYSSEIDKYAIMQTQHNFSNTIQLGDITKWKEWDINWKDVDLIGAGSPCQGFSFAGKQLAFDDERSKLFFVFVEILNHCKKFNPNVKFLLENVNMKTEYLKIISDYVGLFPVRINSNLVSAQNRDRWYWTNIKTQKMGLFEDVFTDIPQPEDKKIMLKDILDDLVDEKYYLKNPKFGFDGMDLNNKSNSMRTGGKNSQSKKHNYDLIKVDVKLNVSQNQDKASCFTAGGHSGGYHSDMDLLMVGDYRSDEEFRWRDNGKAPTLTKGSDNSGTQYNSLIKRNMRIRRLTPTECSRLQTVPSWYKWIVSDTQIYRMLGNGWTVGVIKHILSFIKCESI